MAPRIATSRALVIVSVFGVVWAHALGLTQFANPTYIDWMIDGDWMAHLFGWLFTRNGPWGVPLAQAPDLIAPTGTSAALTDAIPLLSVIGKVLSPFFGERMQLFGLWMVASFPANGIAGVLVCRAWLKDTASLTLAGCLFVLSPIVTTRYGHPALMSFWLLTGLVGACLWPVSSPESSRRTGAVTLAIGFLACSIHPYLAAMGSALVGASTLRLALLRQVKARESVAWLVAGPVVCASSAYLFGYLAAARTTPMGNFTAEGFGQFSADLLSLFNPGVWSRVMGANPVAFRQYQGFAYHGRGVLVLLVLRLGLLVKYRPAARDLWLALPLLIAVAVMTIYSWSNIVTLAGKPIANWTSFYERLAPWPSVFRGSGRFMWPLAALLTLTAVLTAARLRTPWVRQFVLGGAVLLQLADLDPAHSGLQKAFPPFEPFKDPAWQLMKEGYKHVVVNPVQLQWICPFDGKYIAALSWEVYRQHLSINSGHVGRAPVGTDCTHRLLPTELDRETIYVPFDPRFAVDAFPMLACAQVDGRLLCVMKDYDTPLLRTLLERSREK